MAMDTVCACVVFTGGAVTASASTCVTSIVDDGRLLLTEGDEVPAWLDRRSPTRLSMKLSRSFRSTLRLGGVDAT